MSVVQLARTFVRKPSEDRRLLLLAWMLHGIVVIGVRTATLGTLRRLLDRFAASPLDRLLPDAERRVVKAVESTAAFWPSTTCLTTALVAECLLTRHRCRPVLRIGLNPAPAAARPFAAHAWVECDSRAVIGASATEYEPLLPHAQHV